MSTVTPPSPPLPLPALAALPRTIIVDAPPALTDLPSGTKLDVIVSQILDATKLKLKSPIGDITVKLSGPTNVKAGDALILQLLGSGTSTRSLLSQPNGLPLTYTRRVHVHPRGGRDLRLSRPETRQRPQHEGGRRAYPREGE